jgi:hypothetical protein
MDRFVTAWTAAVALALAASAGAETWKPEPLQREREIAAALAAGPAHFREQAGVYVLGEGGFELARESRNGFHCLVERSHRGAFEPQCFDQEGSRTLMQAVLMRAELRAAGADDETIRRAVAAGWAEGRLRAPSRPGINYMLSPENRVPIDREGTRIIPYRPHLMFYVPYLTNADLGSDGGPDSTVFVIHEGLPGAYAIVPVPAEPAGHGEAH